MLGILCVLFYVNYCLHLLFNSLKNSYLAIWINMRVLVWDRTRVLVGGDPSGGAKWVRFLELLVLICWCFLYRKNSYHISKGAPFFPFHIDKC